MHSNPEAFSGALTSGQTHYSTFHNEWGDGRMVLIPNKDIQSISIDLQNKVSENTTINKKNMDWLAVLGILIGVLGTIIGIGIRNPVPIIISILLAIIFIAVAVYMKSFKIGSNNQNQNKLALIIISLIEPFYRERGLLYLKIDTKKHDIKEIVEWVKKIQNHCPHIIK